jgi:DNA adenine methylase
LNKPRNTFVKISAVPHLFQYQGSKRKLAKEILKFLPNHVFRIVEPFAGTGAISLAASASGKAERFWLNDINEPLINLVKLAVENPLQLSESYKKIWISQEEDPSKYYLEIRELFNKTQDPNLFLYLLSRCVKGSVRYNSSGLFNQSPDKRRRGTQPDRMKKNIFGVSQLLKGKCYFTSYDYTKVFSLVRENDLIYIDPPYQGVCTRRDTRYSSQIDFDDFILEIDALNQKRAQFIISYDGTRGAKQIGKSLPEQLGLSKIQLDAGRSSQSTLLGKNERTVESLYLSSALSDLFSESDIYKKSTKKHEQLALSY